jgi:deoxyribonuclease V
MKIYHKHPWSISTKEAREIQNNLQSYLILENDLPPVSIKIIAGTDVSYSKINKKLYASVVLFSYPELEFISNTSIESHEDFPYIPGYLSFREIPGLISIFEKLEDDVDLILCDGQGIAHPRRFGLACHLGVLLNKPTIGCAKSRLIGSYAEPPLQKGGFSYLFDHEEKIGLVLRSRSNVKPLFISQGHKICLDDCKNIILDCLEKYRIPEPLRLAHQYCNMARLENLN